MARPWAASVSEVLSAHAVSPSTGLSAAKVTALRAEYGSNELDKEEGTPLWKLVLQQFDDLLVKILLGGTHAPRTASLQRPGLACGLPERRPTGLSLLCGGAWPGRERRGEA